MDYSFELLQSEFGFTLNTPHTCHIRFSKVDTNLILTIDEVKELAKKLRRLAKELRTVYDINVTISGLSKSVLEFENMYKRYIFAVQTINKKYEEVLEFSKQFDNVEYSSEKAKEVAEYYLEVQRGYNHYFYRNGAISICSSIVNQIKEVINEIEHININGNIKQYTTFKRIF